MAHYRFESEWVLTAPITDVFEVMSRPELYSTWWPSVRRSRLIAAGGGDGVGARASYTIRSPLLYRMDFEMTVLEIERPHRIHSLARGDLVGTGTHIFATRGEHTTVTYLWYVSTTKRWMNLVAPVARPLFVWAHHGVMRDGCAGLARHLGARLVSTSSRLVQGRPALPDVAPG